MPPIRPWNIALVVALICAASLFAQDTAAPLPNMDAWKPLQFLIGTWEAKTVSGSVGAVSTGTYTFQLELRNHVLSRHTINAGCKGPADFDCEHRDLLYIYQEVPGKSFKAIFFDNEGHVIHYNVSTPTAASAVFLSDSSHPGPQYRLGYELRGSAMFGKFEMRMPGRIDFTTYLEWSGGKKIGAALDRGRGFAAHASLWFQTKIDLKPGIRKFVKSVAACYLGSCHWMLKT